MNEDIRNLIVAAGGIAILYFLGVFEVGFWEMIQRVIMTPSCGDLERCYEHMGPR